jgi:chromosome segregation protein
MRRWDGFVATGQGAAAAERLIRVNRLAEIERALPAAAAELAAADARSAGAIAAIRTAAASGEIARREEAQTAALIREATREEDAAAVALERLALRRGGLLERIAQADADLGDAGRMLSEAEAQVAALPDVRVSEGEVGRLRGAADTAGRALAEVRAEAATHARTVGADKQRADAAARGERRLDGPRRRSNQA